MKNPRKIGLLLLMLVVPVVIFLLLKGTGSNRFSIPRYYPLVDSATGQVRIGTQTVAGREVTDTLFHTVPDFSLTNQEGKTVTSGYLKGKVFVADFFFTRCPGICKKMSSQLTRVQERFLNNRDVQIVSFSVDPENDTVPALQEYAGRYGIRADNWQLLTGDKSQVYRLAKNGYYVTAKEDKPDATDLEERFVHTDKFVLVDRQGRIRGYYNVTIRNDVDRLITEIDILLREEMQ